MDFKSNKIKFAIAAIVLVVIGLVSSRLMQSGEDATGFLRNRGSEPCTVHVTNNEPNKNTIYTERGSSQGSVHFFTLDPSRGCNDDLALASVSLLWQERDYNYRDLDFIENIKTYRNMNVDFNLRSSSISLREPIRETTPFYFNLVSQNEHNINNKCSFQLVKMKFNQKVNVKFISKLRDYNDYDGNDYRALPLGNLISRPSSDVMHMNNNSQFNDNRLINGVNALQKFKLSLNNDSRNNAKLFLLPLRIEKSNFEINSIKLIMNQNGEITELTNNSPNFIWDRDTFDLQFELYNVASDFRTLAFLNQPLITNNAASYKLEVTGRRINENFPAKLKSYVKKESVQYCINVPENNQFIINEIDFDCYIGLDKSNENPISLIME